MGFGKTAWRKDLGHYDCDAAAKPLPPSRRRLDRQPACLNHRDYHSWNLMIHDEAVCVIDFQDALLAPPQYDLASLLNDRITDAVIQPHMEPQLVEYYRERANELSGRNVSRQEFLEIYRLVGDPTRLESRRPLLLSRSGQRQTGLYEIRSAHRAPAPAQSRPDGADQANSAAVAGTF